MTTQNSHKSTSLRLHSTSIPRNFSLLSFNWQRTFQLAVQIGPGKFSDDKLDVREGTEEDFG